MTSYDYETIPNPNDYLSPLHSYSNGFDNATEYSNDSTASCYSTTYDDIRVSSSLSEGNEEEYFLDPGHSEEAIYASKRFHVISANTIR